MGQKTLIHLERQFDGIRLHSVDFLAQDLILFYGQKQGARKRSLDQNLGLVAGGITAPIELERDAFGLFQAPGLIGPLPAGCKDAEGGGSGWARASRGRLDFATNEIGSGLGGFENKFAPPSPQIHPMGHYRSQFTGNLVGESSVLAFEDTVPPDLKYGDAGLRIERSQFSVGADADQREMMGFIEPED
jgi:hypothetical protein